MNTERSSRGEYRMSRCVLDTCVCLDLSNAGLLKVALKLPYRFELPDIIAEELTYPAGDHLVDLGYTTISMPDVNLINTLKSSYPKPSTNDLFALACAKQHHGILLTGDAALRSAAESEGVEVHGVLWIFDELVSEDILTPTDAAISLERVIEGGSWLPRHDCQERLHRWRK